MIKSKMAISAFLIWISFEVLSAGERGSIFPYISGDTFRSYCDYIVDETAITLIPEQVKEGEVIFLKTDYLDFFFEQLHPRIASRYILVTHNSDHPCPGSFSHFLEDSKLIAWFGQNLEGKTHPKLHPIPIGLANRSWEHGSVEVLDEIRQKLPAEKFSNGRKILLYMNFQPATYPPERPYVYQLFRDKSFCTTLHQTDFRSYLVGLALARFVLSPRGNGLDCHRTWEALWMGAIPIVKSSSLDPLYAGLPVLIVKDWREINEKFLRSKWKEMKSKQWAWERLEAGYWLNLIRSKKNF